LLADSILFFGFGFPFCTFRIINFSGIFVAGFGATVHSIAAQNVRMEVLEGKIDETIEERRREKGKTGEMRHEVMCGRRN
jgi:hypothetical protein